MSPTSVEYRVRHVSSPIDACSQKDRLAELLKCPSLRQSVCRVSEQIFFRRSVSVRQYLLYQMKSLQVRLGARVPRIDDPGSYSAIDDRHGGCGTSFKLKPEKE